jgi:hypothetical protein
MKKQSLVLTFFLLFIMFSFSSCAPDGDTYKEYGFFSGILHGFLFPFALIGKLFSADCGLYAENNTGFFYWIGFILGIGGLGGGGSAASRR